MAPLTRSALVARFAGLLLCALATRGTLTADSGGASGYVMAPGDPTFAPSDPTMAPEGKSTSRLANPGAILEFTYR